MNFLIVNDDGIDSRGIRALADALSTQGKIFVSAPAKQQSGKSQSITFMESIEVEVAEFEGAELAWKVHGTPADCTKIGLQLCALEGHNIDIVFSGINQGSNLGTDTLYSGTVGAAMESILQGIRAVAVSVGDHNASHFEVACDLAVQIIPIVMWMDPTVVININTPNLPREEIKGLKYAALGPSFFLDGFVYKEGNTYQLEGHVPDFSHLGEALDVGANSLGYATITPLKPDHTDYEILNVMKEWNLKV